MSDPWKRPLKNIGKSYPTQPDLSFKPKEATPEEFEEWQEKELNWWADKQLIIIAIAAVVQLSALAFMASVMYVTGLGLYGV